MVAPYYDADGITIYHADCRDVLPVACAAIVVDPPYGIQWKRSVNLARWSKAHDGIDGDTDTGVRDGLLAVMADTPAIVFGSFYAPFPLSLKQVLIWHKPPDSGLVGCTTGFRRDAEPIFLVGPWPVRKVQWSSVLRSSGQSIKTVAIETGHPHTKPVDLLRQLIGVCPPGVICDPCMGTGSTLVAAKLHGRKAIGIEVDERYCEIAARRLAQRVLPLADDGDTILKLV